MTTQSTPKISQSKLRQFIESLPQEMRSEHYQLLGLRISVPRALFVIQEFGLQPETLDREQLETIAKNNGVAYIRGGSSFNLLDRRLDDAWIETLLTNPEKAEHPLKQDPIIFAEVTIGRGKGKRPGWLLIEGGHRLRYHYLAGSPSIQIYMIPVLYEKLIKG